MSAPLPFGSWPSPITAEVVVAGSVSLSGPAWQPVDDDPSIAGWLWWSELRPEEQGRVQLVRRAIDARGQPVGVAVDVLPAGFSARTRVHEYGGGAWWLGGPAHPGTVCFANWDDQRLYRYTVGAGAPVALTPEPAARHGLRYADGEVSIDGRWIVCVREQHDADRAQPRNEIVALPASGAEPDESAEQTVLVTGPDFVSNPRLSPDGSKLCWIQWDHPNMPWDDTELWVAAVETTSDRLAIRDAAPVRVGSARSWLQPRWAPQGEGLWTIRDPKDKWVVRPLWPTASGSGWSGSREDATTSFGSIPTHESGEPAWVFGQSDYCLFGETKGASIYHRDGVDTLMTFDGDVVQPDVGVPFTSMTGLVSVGDQVGMIAASFATEPEVVLVRPGDRHSSAEVTVVRPARDLGIEPSWFSVPRHLEFATTPYDDGSPATAFALYYPPHHPEQHPDRRGPSAETPPLLVLSHGGPTGAARAQLQLGIQYWTTRGIAVVDVNYRGSTGYGRAYRDALAGKWGIYDTDDCIAAARHLVDEGEVDAGRLLIKGGSAGGYTTLCALTFHDVFAAGSSLYGVADLGALARDTHKFESRYLDRLVGRWPDDQAIYDERSPINHTDQLATPLIIFQGLEDEVVPPAQAEMMVAALREKGVPFAYLPFAGEQHGFRRAANIKRVVEAELYFFGQMLGFAPADAVEPVPIERP